jgi:hypothetical protein
MRAGGTKTILRSSATEVSVSHLLSTASGRNWLFTSNRRTTPRWPHGTVLLLCLVLPPRAHTSKHAPRSWSWQASYHTRLLRHPSLFLLLPVPRETRRVLTALLLVRLVRRRYTGDGQCGTVTLSLFIASGVINDVRRASEVAPPADVVRETFSSRLATMPRSSVDPRTSTVSSITVITPPTHSGGDVYGGSAREYGGHGGGSLGGMRRSGGERVPSPYRDDSMRPGEYGTRATLAPPRGSAAARSEASFGRGGAYDDPLARVPRGGQGSSASQLSAARGGSKGCACPAPLLFWLRHIVVWE